MALGPAQRGLSAGRLLADTVGQMRAHGRAVIVWAALLALWNFVVGALFGPLIAQQALVDGRPSVLLGLASGLVTLAGSAVVFAASLRAVLEPGAERRFFLRFGRDEARLFALFALAMLVAVPLGFVIGLILGLLVAVIAVWTQSGMASALGGLVATFLTVGFFFYVSVRLVPVWALTLMRGHLAIGPGWRLSEGRFRPLCLAALAIALVSVVLFILLGLAVLALIAGPALGSLLHPTSADATAALTAIRVEMASAATPGVMAARLLGGFAGGVVLAAHGLFCASATLRLIDDKAGIG